jgi:agmatinase
MREHARLLQVGVRSQTPEERGIIDRGEVETLFAFQMQGVDWAPGVLGKIAPGSPVYVSVDLDYFDPTLMPATGTPEPGGGQWYPTLGFLRGLSERARIVGFDIMELAPIRGPARS